MLLPKSFGALNEVVSVLKNNENLKLIIEGHTDNVGDPMENQVLSEKRAKAVFNYLFDKGIPQTRLNAVGFGEQKPIIANNTPGGRASNRRVELKLYY